LKQLKTPKTKQEAHLKVAGLLLKPRALPAHHAPDLRQHQPRGRRPFEEERGEVQDAQARLTQHGQLAPQQLHVFRGVQGVDVREVLLAEREGGLEGAQTESMGKRRRKAKPGHMERSTEVRRCELDEVDACCEVTTSGSAKECEPGAPQSRNGSLRKKLQIYI
jgi:hypothetical protein